MIILNNIVDITSGHVGKAGEHLVASELLFRGYNASLMSVDVGVDLVATKDISTFLFQIKTATRSSKSYFAYDIRVSSFERHNNSQTYYIFVMRDQGTNFLILPYSELKKYIDKKIVKSYGQEKYRINFTLKDDQLFITNRNNDISYYLNNWEVIC